MLVYTPLSVRGALPEGSQFSLSFPKSPFYNWSLKEVLLQSSDDFFVLFCFGQIPQGVNLSDVGLSHISPCLHCTKWMSKHCIMHFYPSGDKYLSVCHNAMTYCNEVLSDPVTHPDIL